jgi:lysophosphatidate acyltransferase
VETKGLKPDDVTDLTTRVRELMLAELQQMDADLDSADVSSATSSVTNEARTGVKAQSVSAPRLGGVSKLMSYLVGTGSGVDVAKKTAKQREKLVKPGTSGEKPEDFNLVSEGDKGHSSAASTSYPSDIHERTAKKSPSNTSEETDESVVVVKHP